LVIYSPFTLISSIAVSLQMAFGLIERKGKAKPIAMAGYPGLDGSPRECVVGRIL